MTADALGNMNIKHGIPSFQNKIKKANKNLKL